MSTNFDVKQIEFDDNGILNLEKFLATPWQSSEYPTGSQFWYRQGEPRGYLVLQDVDGVTFRPVNVRALEAV